LVNLVRASSQGDQKLFRRTLEALIAEERAKQHHVVAERLSEYLYRDGQTQGKVIGLSDDRLQELFYETIPRRKLEDLILPPAVTRVCNELIEEQHRRELLRSHNVEPRHRVLLVGPPGNGKTALAEALAEALMVPFLTVRYEGVIGSFLGETAARIRRLFDYVRNRQCLLFLDEFDTLGKERGDVHDTGEIKRVVSSLLLQLDDLLSHVVVVTATNHPELLDRAVWRRFQLRLFLPPPGLKQLEEWFRRFEKRLGEPLGFPYQVLAKSLAGLSFAEVEELSLDVMRRRILTTPNTNLKQIVRDRLEEWKAHAGPSSSSRSPRRE
jgi:AAA+ superfamily predicted ATPase